MIRIPTCNKQPVLKAGTVYAGIPYISPSAGGNQMQQAYQYAGFPNKTKLIMDSLRIFKNLLQDEQTVTVTCHISTGECFTVYSGPLTK